MDKNSMSHSCSETHTKQITNNKSLDTWVGLSVVGLTGFFFLVIFPESSNLLRALTVATSMYLVVSIIYHPIYSVFSEPFSPLVILKILSLIAFCQNALFIETTRSEPSTSSLITSMWILLISFVIADLLSLKIPIIKDMGKLRNYSRQQFYKPASTIFFTIYSLGWIWRLYAISNGYLYGTLLATNMEITTYGNLMGAFSQLSTIAFTGLLVFRRRINTILLLLPLEIIWKWAGSSKAGPLYVILPVLVILNIRGVLRLNKRTLFMGITLIFIFLISFVVIHEYRVESQRIILSGGYETFSPLDAIGEISIDKSVIDKTLESILERMGWAFGVAAVIDGMEKSNIGYQYGNSYLRSFSWVVPRALWPSKPGVSLGSWFAQTFLGWSSSSRSEAEITIWGEAYLNFGFIASALIPAFCFVFLQLIYIWCLQIGKFGIFFLGSMYVYILNFPAVNLAVSISSIGQVLLIVTLFYLWIRVTSVVHANRPNNQQGS